HRRAAKRGLERKVEMFRDRAFQQSLALVPCRRVRPKLVEAGIGGHQFGGGFVGIEVVGAGCADHRAADAALARAVDAGEHVKARGQDRCFGRAALTAARPRRWGVASNADAMPALAFGVCMRCNRSSKRAVRSSSAGSLAAINASNSAIDISTALGVLCLVIATAPLTAACSKIVPNSFLKRV